MDQKGFSVVGSLFSDSLLGTYYIVRMGKGIVSAGHFMPESGHHG